MVFAWIFLASTGILLPRYHKYILFNKLVCKMKIWFIFHFPIMISVFVISVIALLIILSDLNWTWVDTSDPLSFSHSIFGIVSIGLLPIQVIICIKTRRTKFNF